MKLKTPEADDKNEMAGRMYEACDLRMAIEGGHLKNLDDVLAWAKKAESGLQALMALPVWVINENCCVDIEASIAHNQSDKSPQKPSTVVFAQRIDHVNCPYCGVEQHANAAAPKGGDYQCDECESVFRVAPKPLITIN